MKRYSSLGGRLHVDVLQLNKDTAYLFDLFITAENMFVAQQVSKAEFAGLVFCFLAGVEWPVFGSQLLGRVARHPENILVSHTVPQSDYERRSVECFRRTLMSQNEQVHLQ